MLDRSLKAIRAMSVVRASVKRVTVTPRKTLAASWAASETGTLFGSGVRSAMMENQSCKSASEEGLNNVLAIISQLTWKSGEVGTACLM
jgi:hypothetical protein